ncbi:MAG: hypothetical protein HUU48_09190 [Flavobacteriales bacterium]|nr:hypothetical protein [Flavobacteriales bacterium]
MKATTIPIEKLFNLNTAANLAAVPASTRIELPKLDIPPAMLKVSPLVSTVMPSSDGQNHIPWGKIIIVSLVAGTIIYVGYRINKYNKEEEEHRKNV